MANQSEPLTALGDPTRRAVFERLLTAPASVQEIADGLPVSRPAVSQHLRTLSDAGLVVVERVGARRYYRPDPSGLARVHAEIEGFWQRALDSYERAIEGREP